MTPTLPPQTSGPVPRRRRWGRVMLLVLLAGIGALGWHYYTGQRALRQLREAGFYAEQPGGPMGERLWKVARSDPLKLFTASTWHVEPVGLRMDEAFSLQLRNFDAVAPALRRVNPDSIAIGDCRSLQNLDGLNGLTALRILYLMQCHSLENVDGPQGCISLESISLNDCTVLRGLKGLEGLPALQSLSLHGCSMLKNVDDLKGPASLKSVSFFKCTALRDVNGLQGLTGLKVLSLTRCDALENLDGVKGLTTLAYLFIANSPKITLEQVTALKAALPHTRIIQ